MFAKVRPDTYNEWLRRVRSGRCDFGLSMSAYAAYGAGFRLWVGPDTHKEWLRRVGNGYSYVRLCLYGLPMEAPCLAERPRQH